MDPKDTLDSVARTVKQEFLDSRRILTFEGYLELFRESPYRLARSAPQFLADMLEHFGTGESEEGPPRFLLFDQDFEGGGTRVHGQLDVQHRVYRLVRAAADEGRTEKLILLTGPNGSGKSVLVEAIYRGLESYSRQPEGALYRFNWVFPKSSVSEDGLGFGVRGRSDEDLGSFALLEGEDISARLPCEMKDHPLFLIPRREREAILEAALETRPDDRSEAYHWLLEGELCQKCKAVYEGLLTGHQGDWRKLVRHVQVERYFISQRFRVGAVTIAPLGSVDAAELQITADLSVQNLPPVLQNLTLFQPAGDLVDANGGVVEFGDFLKRPMDLNKYLLNAVEKGNISLPNSLAFLNVVMFGTSNEKHLDAFKATPEFTSFKGRIELVPVPYILRFDQEAGLYRDMLKEALRSVHVAPHTFEAAALWAVLTRLMKPDPEAFSGPEKDLVRSLTPLEKARLYNDGQAPDRLEREERKLLLSLADAIREQYSDSPVYEGRFGASAREMRMALTQAAFDRMSTCLTPALVLASIGDLIKDQTVYDFLKLKPADGYHDSEAFVSEVAARYAETVLGELQDAMQLISEEEYDRRFDEYLVHVLAFNRGEKVENAQTGQLEAPSEKIMHGVEDLLEFEESRESFRKNLVARIGAFAVDHPDERVNFRSLFPDLLRAVKQDFFEKRKETVQRLLNNLLMHGTEDFDELEADDRELVETTIESLCSRFGYCPECARDAATFLRANYPD